MGLQESKNKNAAREHQLSEEQRKQHERVREEEAFVTTRIHLLEVAEIASGIRRSQDKAIIANERKLQQQAFLAEQKKLEEHKRLQEEALATARKKLQEEAANLAAQKRKQEETLLASQRKIQEEAAKVAVQKKLQEEAFIAAQKKLQEDADKLAQQKDAARRAQQEEEARKAHQAETARIALQKEAARREQQEEEARKAHQAEATRRAQQEVEARKAQQAEAARIAQQKEAARRAHQEEEARKAHQAEAARRAQQELEARKAHQAEAAGIALQKEAARRAEQAEEARWAHQAEAARIELQKEAARKAQQEQAAKMVQLRPYCYKALKNPQQDKFARTPRLEVAIKKKQEDDTRALREETARSAFKKRNSNLTRNADDLPFCATCHTRSATSMFKCGNGHNFCYRCKYPDRANCTLCGSHLTDPTNYGFHKHVIQTRVPCPHKGKGCVLSMNMEYMEIHLKECPFKIQDCPLSEYFNCQWTGETRELGRHFSEMHPENLADVGSELHLRNIHKECRYLTLLESGYYYIYHLKISEKNNKIYMAVQLIGTKISAKNCVYEIHVYNKSEKRRKYEYTDNCRSTIDNMDEVFESGECAVLPISLGRTFMDNGEATLRLFIKRTKERGRSHDRNRRNRDDLVFGEVDDGNFGQSSTSLTRQFSWSRTYERRRSTSRPRRTFRRDY